MTLATAVKVARCSALGVLGALAALMLNALLSVAVAQQESTRLPHRHGVPTATPTGTPTPAPAQRLPHRQLPVSESLTHAPSGVRSGCCQMSNHCVQTDEVRCAKLGATFVVDGVCDGHARTRCLSGPTIRRTATPTPATTPAPPPPGSFSCGYGSLVVNGLTSNPTASAALATLRLCPVPKAGCYCPPGSTATIAITYDRGPTYTFPFPWASKTSPRAPSCKARTSDDWQSRERLKFVFGAKETTLAAHLVGLPTPPSTGVTITATECGYTVTKVLGKCWSSPRPGEWYCPNSK